MRVRLLAVAVAAPVCAGDAHQLERLDLSSGRHVRAAAQIDEIALLINRNGLFARPHQLVDDLILEPLILRMQDLLRLRRWYILARKGKVGIDQFLHLLFNLWQFLRGEPCGQIEIVEESILNHRANRVLDFLAVQMSQRLGQHMGSAVAHDIEPLRIAIGDDRHDRLAHQLEGEIDQLPIHRGRDRRACQALADRFGQLHHAAAVGDLLDAAVREFDRGHGDRK